MNLLLQCSECGYQESSASHKGLMNKIIMWNHVKKSHPRTAERIMRTYRTLPADLYGVRGFNEAAA